MKNKEIRKLIIPIVLLCLVSVIFITLFSISINQYMSRSMVVAESEIRLYCEFGGLSMSKYEKEIERCDYLKGVNYYQGQPIDNYKIIQEGDKFNIQIIEDYVSPIYREDKVIFLIYPSPNARTTVEDSDTLQKVMSNDFNAVLISYKGKNWFVSEDDLIPFERAVITNTTVPDEIIDYVRTSLLDRYELSRKKIAINFNLIQKYYTFRNTLFSIKSK